MTQQTQQPNNKNNGLPGNHKIFVAVVSHHNEADIIDSLKPHHWHSANTAIVPIILSNVPSNSLKGYSYSHSMIYLENEAELGFGANNNKIFGYICDNLAPAPSDYFFCVNPDIQTDAGTIRQISELMAMNGLSIAAPNLRNQHLELEDNIRSYPTLTDIILRFLVGSKKTTIDKGLFDKVSPVDWASGAFLCFRIGLYTRLKGFDESYYMYYEDADICRRGAALGEQTYYLPHVTAIHRASRKSRSLLSKHLRWHVSSAIRFLQKRNPR